MSRSLALAKELSKWNAVPFALIRGAFIYSDETPAHRFAVAVAPIWDGEYCVVVPSRDFFDESLAAGILDFFRSRVSALSIQNPLVLFDGFVWPQFSFDTIAVLSPAAAGQFEHEKEMLNKRAFVAFPIYRCELSGAESPEVVDLIWHDLLPLLDWTRLLCRKVTMGYRSTKNKAGSRPGLTKLAAGLDEVEKMNGSDGSWIEIENYVGRRCRMEWTHRQYMVEFSDQESALMDESVVLERIRAFVVNDQDNPGPP